MEHLQVELPHQVVQPVDAVEHLDALGVRVVPDLVRPAHGGHPPSELLLGVFEALGDVVDGLVLLVLVRLHGGHLGVEGSVLGLVGDGVEQFAVGGQQAGAVGLHLAVLLAEPELDGEPVDGGQLLDLLVGGTEGGETDLLGELGEAGVRQQWHVTEQLVDAVTATGGEFSLHNNKERSTR